MSETINQLQQHIATIEARQGGGYPEITITHKQANNIVSCHRRQAQRIAELEHQVARLKDFINPALDALDPGRDCGMSKREVEDRMRDLSSYKY